MYKLRTIKSDNEGTLKPSRALLVCFYVVCFTTYYGDTHANTQINNSVGSNGKRLSVTRLFLDFSVLIQRSILDLVLAKVNSCTRDFGQPNICYVRHRQQTDERPDRQSTRVLVITHIMCCVVCAFMPSVRACS